MNNIFFELLQKEKMRITNGINLIASENYASSKVNELVGSVFSAKYAEGWPQERFYSGCFIVDEVETQTINLFKQVFKVEHANVQPHSGSQANQAVLLALANQDDIILSMNFSAGGHLTHGHKLNFSGKKYKFIFYGVDPNTEQINYEELMNLAITKKPKIIIAGGSSYPQLIDFEKISKIAKQVNAIFWVDMAHFAGMVAAKLIPSPCLFADVITGTTHKTLRGPRGGFILSKLDFAKQIDLAVMPGIQGGPHMNLIAAKGQAMLEVLSDEFINYQQQVLNNAQALANCLIKFGFKLVSGGTKTHLVLIDLSKSNLTDKPNGYEAEKLLESINIFVNRNVIPNDSKSTKITSGLRLGTPAITTLGAVEEDIERITDVIYLFLNKKINYVDAQALVRLITQKIAKK